MDLCKYKDIFGEPRKGVHSYRMFDLAIVDVIATYLLSLYISKYYKEYSVLKLFIILMVLSVFIHKIFCVETTLTKMVFK
jgi:hypothetical protein